MSIFRLSSIVIVSIFFSFICNAETDAKKIGNNNSNGVSIAVIDKNIERLNMKKQAMLMKDAIREVLAEKDNYEEKLSFELSNILLSNQIKTLSDSYKLELNSLKEMANSNLLEIKNVNDALVEVKVKGEGWDGWVVTTLAMITILLTVFAILLAVLSFVGYQKIQRMVQTSAEEAIAEISRTRLPQETISGLNRVLTFSENEEDGSSGDKSNFQKALEKIVEKIVADEVEKFIYRGMEPLDDN
jgi:hypothetical protein